MEDGDGVKISPCSEIDNKSSTPVKSEDMESSKQEFARESIYSGNNHSEPPGGSVECKKSGKHISQINDNVPAPDVNLANIIQYKLFFCSSCRTHHGDCDIILHMREYHQKYMCLYCRYLALSLQALRDHLIAIHKLPIPEYSSIEELRKEVASPFYLLCIECDKLFTEMDDSENHKCVPKHSHEYEQHKCKKHKIDEPHQSSFHEPYCHIANDTSKFKAIYQLSNEISSSDSSDSGNSDIDDRVVSRQVVQPEPVKADKEVYCYCRLPYDEVSDMIACDDKNCKIEWFHFDCVGVVVPPRGQWFCPGCRKARDLPT